jgi:hypothetical protein
MSRVIAFASWLLALLGAGLMYVSLETRYRFRLTSLALQGPVKENDDQPAC